jgi:homeobox protein cut-like
VFAEAPDPYPLLDLAVDQAVKVSQAASLEAEASRLRQENTSLQSRIDGQGANDREKRKAERRVEQLEEKLEDLVKERVVAKENELKAIYEERLMNYEDRFVAHALCWPYSTYVQREGPPAPSQHSQNTVEGTTEF